MKRQGSKEPAGSALALFNEGISLAKAGDHEGAIVCYSKALNLEPQSAKIHFNQGNSLRIVGRLKQAIESYGKAIDLQPNYARALKNRGGVYALLRDYPNAVDSYSRALKLDPEDYFTQGKLFHCRAHCCDWLDLATLKDAIQKKLAEGVPGQTPLAWLAMTDNAKQQLRCATLYSNMFHPANEIAPLAELKTGEKIRIAYFSGDFHDHAVSYLMSGVFEKHNRDRFEVFGINISAPKKGDTAQRVKGSFDEYFELGGQDDLRISTLCRKLKIDIAIDLAGYTGHSRTGIFAHRAAPIQVNYLGYPGSMGAPYIDYIIADHYLIPEASRFFYSEAVAYLPDSFQANDDKRSLSAPPPSRHELGLPDSGFVFCSFNNSYKITPDIFSIWMELLLKVPGSLLWLLGRSESARSNLRKEAELRGVHSSRLVFATHLPYAEHLSRLQAADLFLDTLPFNAGTNASDALWAGLPLVTCSGEAFASRMAGSLLTTLGLPELITNNLADYHSLALELAVHPEKLRNVRMRVAHGRTESALFDTQRFTANLESAYEAMWQRRRKNQQPGVIEVRDSGNYSM